MLQPLLRAFLIVIDSIWLDQCTYSRSLYFAANQQILLGCTIGIDCILCQTHSNKPCFAPRRQCPEHFEGDQTEWLLRTRNYYRSHLCRVFGRVRLGTCSRTRTRFTFSMVHLDLPGKDSFLRFNRLSTYTRIDCVNTLSVPLILS